MTKEPRARYNGAFEQSRDSSTGKVSGVEAKKIFQKTSLDFKLLGHIWFLSDLDRDGALDKDEFAIALHLISVAMANPNLPLPNVIPLKMVPPTKRTLAETQHSSAKAMIPNQGQGQQPQPQPQGGQPQLIKGSLTGVPSTSANAANVQIKQASIVKPSHTGGGATTAAWDNNDSKWGGFDMKMTVPTKLPSHHKKEEKEKDGEKKKPGDGADFSSAFDNSSWLCTPIE